MDLIDLIDTRLVKVIGFKLPEDFTLFYLIILRIIMYIIIKFFEYVILLFSLLIVQKGLTILFIFDVGSLEPVPWDRWNI